MAHALVLEAFVGPRPPKHQCNHKDCNKKNNRLENLEWVTAIENVRHAQVHGLRGDFSGEKNDRAILTKQAVKEIRSLKGLERSHLIAPRYGVKAVTIRAVWAGINWKQ